MLSKATWPAYKGVPKDGVDQLCKALQLGANDYRLGKTKIFIRSPNTVRLLAFPFFFWCPRLIFELFHLSLSLALQV